MTLPVRDGETIRGVRQALRTFELSAPLHPILVHFTIALTSASLGFDLIARVFSVASLADAGWWTIAAAAIVTVPTLVSGVTSRMGIPIEEGEARSYLRAHMALGPLFFGLLVALTIWRANIWNDARSVSWWYLASLGSAVIVMTIQGYLGGELVYRYGLDVRGRYRPLPVVAATERPHTTTNP
jgi:uncharacterized membrane protein